MFRSKTRGLLVLALGALALVAVSQAVAARSHVQTWCNQVELADESSETGDVTHTPVLPGDGTNESASARRLVLQARTHAASPDADSRDCEALADFSNTVRVDPGSSGLAVGDPVTLALTVTLDGELGATVDGPSADAVPGDYQALAEVAARLDVTAPDRPVCSTEDGRESCRPAEIASYGASSLSQELGDAPPTAADPDGTALVGDMWSWWLRSDRGESRGDEDRSLQECTWVGPPSCGSTTVPPPPPTDYQGARTILVDAFVGDRLQLDGQLTVNATAQHGSAHADFPVAGTGFHAALVPGPGFDGVILSDDAAATPDVPPACDPVAAQTGEGTPVEGDLSCTDESPSTLTYAVQAGPARGQVELTAAGHYRYTPAAGFHGLDTFQVTAADQAGHISAPVTVTVTVEAVNHPPACLSRPVFATVGQTDELDAECDDPDGDPITIAIVAQGTKGTAVASGQTIEYTPTQAGSDSFTFTASDGSATSEPATITVTILPAPDVLTATIAQAQVVFRKAVDEDRARFTGTFSSTRPPTCGEDVAVRLNGSVFAQTVPGSAFTSQLRGRLCVYTRLGTGGSGGVKRVELDLAASTFVVVLRDEVELSALTNPVTLRLGLGGLEASQTIRMTQSRNRWTYAR